MEIFQARCFSATICIPCRKQAGANTGEASTFKALYTRLAPILVTYKNTINANNESVFRHGNQNALLSSLWHVAHDLCYVQTKKKSKTSPALCWSGEIVCGH